MDQGGNLLSVSDIPLPSEKSPAKCSENNEKQNSKGAGSENTSDDVENTSAVSVSEQLSNKKTVEDEKSQNSFVDASKSRTLDDNALPVKPLSALEMLKETYDEEPGSSEEEDLLRSESDEDNSDKKGSHLGSSKTIQTLVSSFESSTVKSGCTGDVLNSSKLYKTENIARKNILVAEEKSNEANESLKTQTQQPVLILSENILVSHNIDENAVSKESFNSSEVKKLTSSDKPVIVESTDIKTISKKGTPSDELGEDLPQKVAGKVKITSPQVSDNINLPSHSSKVTNVDSDKTVDVLSFGNETDVKNSCDFVPTGTVDTQESCNEKITSTCTDSELQAPHKETVLPYPSIKEKIKLKLEDKSSADSSKIHSEVPETSKVTIVEPLINVEDIPVPMEKNDTFLAIHNDDKKLESSSNLQQTYKSSVKEGKKVFDLKSSIEEAFVLEDIKLPCENLQKVDEQSIKCPVEPKQKTQEFKSGNKISESPTHHFTDDSVVEKDKNVSIDHPIMASVFQISKHSRSSEEKEQNKNMMSKMDVSVSVEEKVIENNHAGKEKSLPDTESSVKVKLSEIKVPEITEKSKFQISENVILKENASPSLQSDFAEDIKNKNFTNVLENTIETETSVKESSEAPSLTFDQNLLDLDNKPLNSKEGQMFETKDIKEHTEVDKKSINSTESTMFKTREIKEQIESDMTDLIESALSKLGSGNDSTPCNDIKMPKNTSTVSSSDVKDQLEDEKPGESLKSALLESRIDTKSKAYFLSRKNSVSLDVSLEKSSNSSIETLKLESLGIESIDVPESSTAERIAEKSVEDMSNVSVRGQLKPGIVNKPIIEYFHEASDLKYIRKEALNVIPISGKVASKNSENRESLMDFEASEIKLSDDIQKEQQHEKKEIKKSKKPLDVIIAAKESETVAEKNVFNVDGSKSEKSVPECIFQVVDTPLKKKTVPSEALSSILKEEVSQVSDFSVHSNGNKSFKQKTTKSIIDELEPKPTSCKTAGHFPMFDADLNSSKEESDKIDMLEKSMVYEEQKSKEMHFTPGENVETDEKRCVSSTDGIKLKFEEIKPAESFDESIVLPIKSISEVGEFVMKGDDNIDVSSKLLFGESKKLDLLSNCKLSDSDGGNNSKADITSDLQELKHKFPETYASDKKVEKKSDSFAVSSVLGKDIVATEKSNFNTSSSVGTKDVKNVGKSGIGAVLSVMTEHIKVEERNDSSFVVTKVNEKSNLGTSSSAVPNLIKLTNLSDSSSASIETTSTVVIEKYDSKAASFAGAKDTVLAVKSESSAQPSVLTKDIEVQKESDSENKSPIPIVHIACAEKVDSSDLSAIVIESDVRKKSYESAASFLASEKIAVVEKLDSSEISEKKVIISDSAGFKSTDNKVYSEASKMNKPSEKSQEDSVSTENPIVVVGMESKVFVNTLQSQLNPSKSENIDFSSQSKGKESPEPTKRIKLIRPVFKPTTVKDVDKQSIKKVSPPNTYELNLSKEESTKITKKDDLEKQSDPSSSTSAFQKNTSDSDEPIKLNRLYKKAVQPDVSEVPSHKIIPLKNSDKRDSSSTINEKLSLSTVTEKQDKPIEHISFNTSSEPVSSEKSKETLVKKSVIIGKEPIVFQSQVIDSVVKHVGKDELKLTSDNNSDRGNDKLLLKIDTSIAKEQSDSVTTKGDAENSQTVKTPDSPKRVRLVRPITKKPVEKPVTSVSLQFVSQASLVPSKGLSVTSQPSSVSSQPTFSKLDSRLLRERLEEKHDVALKTDKCKSDELIQVTSSKQATIIVKSVDELNEKTAIKKSKVIKISVEDLPSMQSSPEKSDIIKECSTASSKAPIVAKEFTAIVQPIVDNISKLSKEGTQLPVLPKSTPQSDNIIKSDEGDFQNKQLEYTLKIGKACTTIIPKEEKSIIVQNVPGKPSSSDQNSVKVCEILKDSDVTLTPISQLSKVAISKHSSQHKEKSNIDNENWKHLTDIKILSVEKHSNKKPEELGQVRDKIHKDEEQESAILTTSSGVKINIQSTPPKVLNALISEAQASSNSDDVQFVKCVPPSVEIKSEPLEVSSMKQEILNVNPPKRRRGRPRKIPLEPRPMMQQMLVGPGQSDEYTAGLFPVPLFDMSETMFTTPTGHHTLFPDQVIPGGNRPQRTCRGRVKLPSVRTRRPRGSSIARRASSSGRGRGRGRGFKRKFTEDENIITIENVEQEMMRNQMAGRRRLSAGSRLEDEDEASGEGIKREIESEEDKKLSKAERILKKKEEKKLRQLEKKRMKLEAREKEKAAAIEAALAEEETRMSAPEGTNKDGQEGLYRSFSEKGEKRKLDSGLMGNEVSETPIPAKRKKEHYFCCICLEETPLRKLTSPLDHRSWTVLYEAAIVRQYEPILKLTDDMNKEIPPKVLYHRNCRSEFTHKKTLAKLTETTVGEIAAAEQEKQANQLADQAANGGSKEFTVDQIAEYQWPLQGGELFMIQEQISTYLGVKSFKRKYPDIKRRSVEMEERQWLCDNGLVSESLCDLGLTAVSSAEVLDIMFADFPEKYEEFRKHIREKQARELSSKQKAALYSLLDKKKMEQRTDTKQEAIQSAANWNSNLNKTRGEHRRCSLDLQSLVIHYPKTKGLKMLPPNHQPQRVGHYPVALIPGQYCDYYQSYTPDELRYFPLDTVLYGPMKPNERLGAGGGGGSDGSQTDSDDSSSSDESSDTSSEGTQDTEGTCEEDDKDKVKDRQMEEVHCKVCGGDKTRNKQDNPEVLITCDQCTKSSHLTCIGLTVVMVPHIQRYGWQCTDCKTCFQCKDPADEDKMLFCDLCDRGYHIYCVGLRKVPMGRWHCQVCSVCNSCGTTDPGGPDWQHEYKKGEKNTRIYIQTLCAACSKLWRKGRYCQICLRCHSNKPEEDPDLVQCTACDRWMHAECCRTTGGTILGSNGLLCETCQERAMPKAVQRVVRQ